MNKEGRCEKKKADRYMREGRRGRKKVQTREEQNKVEEKGKSLFLFFKLIKKKQRTTYKIDVQGPLQNGKSGLVASGGGIVCATSRGLCGREMSATTTPLKYHEK
jgi:hypothetical protein